MRPCAATWLIGVAMLSGCARQAYNELYIENMAAEIRELEDQLYEYDHEYRILEQHLAALRAENERLKAQGSTGAGSTSGATPRPPERLPSRAPGSILEFGRPAEESSDSNTPSGEGERSAPSQQPEFNPDQLVPPTIEPGEPIDPQATGETLGLPTDTEDPLLTESTRIEIPGRLASNVREMKNAADQEGDPAPQDLEQVTDRRVVELAFHPSLTRAANFDEELDDDGLYLVIQPLNAAGQMVPVAADLAVVVLDPAREGDAARIGRWNFSAQDVASKLQTIGSNRGIHLTLPWQGPDPIADRVIVFTRYTFPDGRQVIGEKTVFVSGPDGRTTTWVPRGGDPAAGQNQSVNGIVPAGFQPSSAGMSSKAAAIRIVRPAGGNLQAEPAPAPTDLPDRRR
ncbi:MAG: hypothetical protein D6753_17130 [Planctomycetota bacterium]|nr:MAG: hypothetical protein D6753_17130 [Planctomycetota bacterium]